MRTLVFGDIHGGLKALVQLLAKAKVTTEDTLIFLGDLVDGWSESAQLIDYLMELDAQQTCVFVKGNHDAICEDWLRTGVVNEPTWLTQGGQATLDSYARYSDEQKNKHLQFFEKMKVYHLSAKNQLFVHAGFTSMHGVEKEFHKTDLYWDRTLWEAAWVTDRSVTPDSLRYPTRLKLYSEIYIGHTPTTKFGSDLPIRAMNLWNLDTGAAFKGRLSCIDTDSKAIYQSDIVQNFYPTELGRNKEIQAEVFPTVLVGNGLN